MNVRENINIIALENVAIDVFFFNWRVMGRMLMFDLIRFH